MNWEIGLHGVTIKQCKTVKEKIKLASKAGYCSIDLDYADVFSYLSRGNQIQSLTLLLRKYKLKVNHMGVLHSWQFNDGIPLIWGSDNKPTDGKSRLLEKVHLFFQNCAALGCKYTLAIPAIKQTSVFEDMVDSYRKLCSLAADYEIYVALEFVGFAQQINNLKKAWEIVKASDCINAGILLDTFHFYRGESSIQDLIEIPVRRILTVHINDAQDKPKDLLKDTDRVTPGEGVIPLREILQVLREREYGGYFSIEILNRKYWEDDPLKIAVKARKATEGLLKSVWG